MVVSLDIGARDFIVERLYGNLVCSKKKCIGFSATLGVRDYRIQDGQKPMILRFIKRGVEG